MTSDRLALIEVGLINNGYDSPAAEDIDWLLMQLHLGQEAIEAQARRTAYFNGQPDGDRLDWRGRLMWQHYLCPEARNWLGLTDD